MKKRDETEDWISLKLWLTHRFFLERFLLLVALLSLILCTVTLITLFLLNAEIGTTDGLTVMSSIKNNNQNEPKVCLTPGCVRAAAEILHYIDESVDPCDDFHAFACGGFLKEAVIQQDDTSASVKLTLEKELQRRLLEMIENTEKDSASFIQKVKNAYDACMNTTEIERLGSDPIDSVLQELGGWPVVIGRRWEPYFFDWMETMKSIRGMGFTPDIFIKVDVRPDMKNNTRYIIEIGQPSLGIDYAYLLKGLEDPAVFAYYRLMVDSAVLLGAELDVAEGDMLETLIFEMELAKIIVPREQTRDYSKNYRKMKVVELDGLAPEIEWNMYLRMRLKQDILTDEDVTVFYPTYVQKMSQLVARKDQDNPEKKRKRKRVLANYMMWRIVLESMRSLSKNWRNLYQEYNLVLTGVVREADRWQQCLTELSLKLPMAIGSLYAGHYLNPEIRYQVTDIAKYIHQAFLHNLDYVDWMDDETKSRAIKKAENMILRISCPDELLDYDKISAIHSDLHLDPMNHFGNFKAINKWSVHYNYMKLRKSTTREDWKNWHGVAVVNADYTPRENALEIAGGIIQDFFFSVEKPKYLNFGAIGFVIGHEVTHGFDDQGHQFDHVGNHWNWWDDKTEKNFKERAQCMVYQYGNYTNSAVGMAVNGINTLGENIADNGGVRLAFSAYEQWVSENEEENMLPALNYTPAQLFWISAVGIHCIKQRPEDLKNQILSNPHAPYNYRLNGELSNSEEFSNTFKCPVGSPMNPVKKCVVW